MFILVYAVLPGGTLSQLKVYFKLCSIRTTWQLAWGKKSNLPLPLNHLLLASRWMKLFFRCHLSSLDQNQMPGWHIKESYSCSRPQGPNKDAETHERQLIICSKTEQWNQTNLNKTICKSRLNSPDSWVATSCWNVKRFTCHQLANNRCWCLHLFADDSAN